MIKNRQSNRKLRTLAKQIKQERNPDYQSIRQSRKSLIRLRTKCFGHKYPNPYVPMDISKESYRKQMIKDCGIEVIGRIQQINKSLHQSYTDKEYRRLRLLRKQSLKTRNHEQ